MADKQVKIYSPLNNLVHPETEASIVKVVDAGGYYTNTNVETVLQEIGVALSNASGATGDAATIAVGTVTTLAPGSAATIVNVGTSSAAVFDFGIPKGDTGASSAAEVTVADVGAYYTGTTVEEVLADIGLNYAKKFSPDFSGYPTINGNLIVTSTKGAIDYYVSPVGSDSNNGNSDSPFLTIGYAISKIPKILRHPVTINVAPGTYAENIIIDGFTGIQKISLKGGANSTEALNYIVNRITLENNTVEVYIRGFKSISTSWHPFDVNNCTKFSFYSCVTTDVTTVYNGFNISSSNGYIYDCVAGFKKYALKSYSNSNVFSYSWDSGSTDNEVGLYASEGGTIYNSGGQPSGTTNTAVAFGGIITGSIINPAPLASPSLTGTPVAPTAAVGTNTTQLATTAFVNAEIANDAAAKVHSHVISDTTDLQTALDAKQDILISATNIKTINGSSILGSGNLTISGGSPTENSVVLLSSSWTGSSVPYIYTLTVNGVTNNSIQNISPAITITALELESLQLANIIDGGQSTNTIILKSFGIKPTIDLPLRILVSA